MRLAGMALCALVVSSTGSARAQSNESPWCTELDPFTRYCVYASQRDCMVVAKDAGATCVQNPRYQPPPANANAKPRRQPQH